MHVWTVAKDFLTHKLFNKENWEQLSFNTIEIHWIVKVQQENTDLNKVFVIIIW